jgi:hypothetical protein
MLWCNVRRSFHDPTIGCAALHETQTANPAFATTALLRNAKQIGATSPALTGAHGGAPLQMPGTLFDFVGGKLFKNRTVVLYYSLCVEDLR